MEISYPTPFLDMLKRGQLDRDVRLMTAQGALSLRPDEQRDVLKLLMVDPDLEVAQAAAASVRAGLFGDVPPGSPAETEGQEKGEQAAEVSEVNGAEEKATLDRLATMNPAERLARAIKGTQEERSILIRDSNKIVAAAVLSSPKISESEVEAIAKMTNVSDEILRIIGNTRAWVKSYRVVSALTRNPKTPLTLSMNLLSRLHEKDVRLLVSDRNVPDSLRSAARNRLAAKR